MENFSILSNGFPIVYCLHRCSGFQLAVDRQLLMLIFASNVMKKTLLPVFWKHERGICIETAGEAFSIPSG